MISISDTIGLSGVIITLVAYVLLQIRRLPSGFIYSLLNALGSIGILISLYFKFNLSAFLLESIWLLMSLYGMVRR